MDPSIDSGPDGSYNGFTIEPTLERTTASDGEPIFRCVLIATSAGDRTPSLMFERTIELSGKEAELTNQFRPGSMPSKEQMDTRLLAIGAEYMRQLIDLVTDDPAAIARVATVQVSEVRARLGMSSAALYARER